MSSTADRASDDKKAFHEPPQEALCSWTFSEESEYDGQSKLIQHLQCDLGSRTNLPSSVIEPFVQPLSYSSK